MKKTLMAVLLAVLGAASARADDIVSAYDVTSGGFTYCSTSGLRQGQGFIKTTGASTTVTAVGTAVPFTSLVVGDEITVITAPDTTPVVRYVTARASAVSITISGANVDWSNGGAGYGFTWRHVACGTTSADGWIQVQPGASRTVQVIVTTINATSINVSFEGRIDGVVAVATPLLPTIAYTAATSEFITLPETIDAFRVGWSVTGDAGVQSVSALFQEGGQF